MLFSNDEVSDYINDHFEPLWQSVRPVPIVTIDFGNGTIVRRTLHGNVATVVCASDGGALDILPGIYEPKTYLARLKELVQLHRYVTQSPLGVVNKWLVRDYHRRQAAALEAGRSREVFVEIEANRRSILRVESGVVIVLRPAQRIQTRAAVAQGTFPKQTAAPKVDSPDDLPGWKALAEDTRINETLRRAAIHKHLTDLGPVAPAKITRWLYKEVLHADLDDPYLGLGKILFDNYPFQDGQDRPKDD